jgi:hypothetical protein
LLVLAAGCGRFGFGDHAATADASIDAQLPDAGPPPVDYGSGCAVGLSFDEAMWTGAAGEVLDSCGNGNNGTDALGATRVDDPDRGRVAQFPNLQGCVLIPNAASLHATTGLTMSAWLYPTGLDAVDPYGVISKRTDYTNDDTEYDFFLWTDNTVWVDLDTHANRVQGTKGLANDVWQQVTVVFDGTQPEAQRISIYIDAVLDVQLPEPDTTLPPYASTLSIGCLPQLPATESQQSFFGKLDDVAVWTRAFSVAEVTAWHDATAH